MFHWDGSREKLQESPMFHGKSMVSGSDFPRKTNPLKRTLRGEEITRKRYCAATLEFPKVSAEQSDYPLVNIQKAIENGHRNSGFSH
jgi:hypothetical protein